MARKYQPTYWNHKGKYQAELELLQGILIPHKGEACTKQGQLLLCLSNLYHERYNNGWGNAIGHYTRYIRKYMKSHKLNIKVTQAMSEKDFDKAIDKVLKHLKVTLLEPCGPGDKVYGHVRS